MQKNIALLQRVNSFIHTVGRMLGRLGLESTPIASKGFEILLEAARNTIGDSFDLYYGIFMYNFNSNEQN